MQFSSINIDNERSSVASTTLNVIVFAAVALLSLLLQPTPDDAFPYHYEEGKTWTYETLTAEWDYPLYKDEEKVKQERQKALESYAPCYRWVSYNKQSVPILSAKDMREVEKGGYDHITIVNNRHRTKAIPLSQIYTPKMAFEQTGREMDVNLQFDSVTTAEVYKGITESVSLTEGAVMKGETIVKYGEQITPEVYQRLSSLNRIYDQRGLSRQHVVWSYTGRTLLALVFVGLFVLYLITFRKPLWEQTRAPMFFCLLIALMEMLSALVLRLTDASLVYILPFTWIPILIRMFYDSRTAYFVHLTTVMLVSLSVPDPFLFLLLQLPTGMVAVVSLKDLTRRSQLAFTAIYILLTYAFVYTLYHLALTGDVSRIDLHIFLYFALNGLLIITVYSLVYLFEKMFRLVSSLTLVELSNINSDLMQTFAEKAPGTFQHSLQVSNLASEAAKSINADALLMRTAALYHDIGKLAHPTWFIENQNGGENPLLAMSNRDAARAVIAHVEDGERYAREHRLPDVVRMFIRTHHGTSLVRYFYNSEVNRLKSEGLDPGSHIHEEDFRYAGPKPETKETAILMMADAIEARSRTLDSYTEQSLNDMVEQMVAYQIEDGQLAETPLTFNDLSRIKQVFKERLKSMYHHRIQYPDLKQ
ncbi:MAG: HDIG domain-containing protein [Paludibacteraceae bacterium]|nr:HDIG domain-containing protein [Paludibacteraceae bacterium]